MAVKIRFYYTLVEICLAVASIDAIAADKVHPTIVPVNACVVVRNEPLTAQSREHIAACLGWENYPSLPLCHGAYHTETMASLPDEDEIQINANHASLYEAGRSKLEGHVEVRQSNRIVNAKTAYIYRDKKTKQVTQIKLIGDVRFLEPDKLMLAKKATLNPVDKSGEVEDVLYRFRVDKKGAVLPAWGMASFIKRFANEDYWLRKATYTTCPPKDKAWQIEASEIIIDHAKGRGVAKNARLRLLDFPVVYTPYLSFPTTRQRKSGFLMPSPGFSNVGGFDLATPYYWNMAPNYDATLVPHLYTLRGMMVGGRFRYLTKESVGSIEGHVLPNDHAFQKFLVDNQSLYPELQNVSSDRWSVQVFDKTLFNPNLEMNINYQQVSDDYYWQDFSSNLAIMTQNQLLRQGNLTYATDHWVFSGMVQSYQTLHPIDQSTIANIYERLPELEARASYGDLPFNANFNLLSEFDYYRWPGDDWMQPEGPRYHLNPVLSFPMQNSWGYITPSLQLMENYYEVQYIGADHSNAFNRTIPRYSVDTGLTFERYQKWMGQSFTQTLEPRLFYLNVPYHDQTPVPVYDSAYMIFNMDQLFRMNRFSGIDRVGDANQLAYALTSRWLSQETGLEKASLAVGQIRYFKERRVDLCYQPFGNCVDNPLFLGYVSPNAQSSPIASRATYQFNPDWRVSGDYVWDGYTHKSNNGNFNFHYQPETNHIINFGYSYLVNGNVLQVGTDPIEASALHQATIAGAWPLSEHWSGLGAYSYNISKNYSMMAFLGMQYDTCCWALRLMGGRAFQSLSPDTLLPQYNNNIYLQIMLKGLGSVASSDPASIITSYLPGYQNMF